MTKKKSKVDPNFDLKQESKQRLNQGSKQAKVGKAISKKKPKYGYTGDMKKPDKTYTIRSSKAPEVNTLSTSQKSQGNINGDSDDDFTTPLPKLPTLRYVHPPPRAKVQSIKLKKSKEKSIMYSLERNEVDELSSSDNNE